jgi:hypothetical protein
LIPISSPAYVLTFIVFSALLHRFITFLMFRGTLINPAVKHLRPPWLCYRCVY